MKSIEHNSNNPEVLSREDRIFKYIPELSGDEKSLISANIFAHFDDQEMSVLVEKIEAGDAFFFQVLAAYIQKFSEIASSDYAGRIPLARDTRQKILDALDN